MRQLALGILAHVDAGKTTLSEGMLYRTGQLRSLGRVDHQTAFLDTDAMERQRGITIFSKEARFQLGDVAVTLLDTPGHVDFSAEMERTLSVIDCALLVVSGSDGVQGHTQTLWGLLKRLQIPTFIFINKMDLPDTSPEKLLLELKSRLHENCLNFSPEFTQNVDFWESIALCDENLMSRYLEGDTLGDGDIASLIANRQLFPCFFGSALKLEGIDTLLEGIGKFAPQQDYSPEFGARVYKISRDTQNNRLTHLKLTGGNLAVKALISGESGDVQWQEKIQEIRLYSGTKYQPTDQIYAGTVCAVTGLTNTYAGQGLGCEEGDDTPILTPVLSHRVILPEGCDPHTALKIFRQLEEEDPQLRVIWSDQTREITLQLMGQIQLEILAKLVEERFDLSVEFGRGSIVYRETIATPVVGIGHFEPLRHYAEVQLMLEPLPRGSGIQCSTACSLDDLALNWQRLILTHLEERAHRGVLTGFPLTDVRITLTAGIAHLKHTEGGDFRQATYRAVRQGLMSAESVLLEPYYNFLLEVPAEQIGRAMTDLQRMQGEFSPPEITGEMGILQGCCPVSTMEEYGGEVIAYTRGRGRLTTTPGDYAPCHNQEEVVAQLGYSPEADLLHTPDSVFCKQGAGFSVPWYEVPDYAHLTANKQNSEPEAASNLSSRSRKRGDGGGSIEQDKELMAIFERTYGKVRERGFQPYRKAKQTQELGDYRPKKAAPVLSGPEYLLVDGYNIIFAWEDLKALAQENLAAARQMLMELLSNYQGFAQCEVILVFDAYKVPRGVGEVSKYHNIHVVYTKEAETADAYIEKTTYQLAKQHRVRVATSDGVEQLIILGHGALRISATTFRQEMNQMNHQIASILNQQNRAMKSGAIRAALERAEKEKNNG